MLQDLFPYFSVSKNIEVFHLRFLIPFKMPRRQQLETVNKQNSFDLTSKPRSSGLEEMGSVVQSRSTALVLVFKNSKFRLVVLGGKYYSCPVTFSF